jgi:Zn-dependent alcohol dehydrogenase
MTAGPGASVLARAISSIQRSSARTWSLTWYMQGKIEIDPMITHVMPLSEINNAFELMKRGESIRGVVTF